MADILVVDDRSVNRDLLVGLLAPQGHRLFEADDGQEALRIAQQQRPDLVICDILMPTMDGYEFVRLLRQLPELAGVRVIFWTAHYHAREATDLARASGVLRVLLKPSEPEEILRVVEAALAEDEPDRTAALGGGFVKQHLRLVTDKLFETVRTLRQGNERLHALVELNLHLQTRRDPLRLLEEVCHGARRLIASQHCMLVARTRSANGTGAGESAHLLCSGLSQEAQAAMPLPAMHEGLLGAMLVERRGLRLVNPQPGQPLAGLPAGFPPVKALLAAPMMSPAAPQGWICLLNKMGTDSFSDDDEMLLSLLAALAGGSYESALDYQRRERHAAQQVQSLSRRLVEAQESERQQLARELHDRVGQNLTALALNLDLLKTRGLAAGRAELQARLDDSILLVETTSGTIENVMSELRPPMLDDHGLLDALQWYAQQFSMRTDIRVKVHGHAEVPRIGPAVEITLFRIAQEALTNVLKHAQARYVDLRIEQRAHDASMHIADDGQGFDPAGPVQPGYGLATMRERAQALGGTLTIDSAPHAGTRVHVRMPLPA
jgi:signal transduction histidine kinase